MKIDRKSQFSFSALQSEYAANHLPAEYTRELSTIVVQINGQNYRKTKAVMMVFKELGGVWGALSWLSVLPEDFTNHLYDQVARNRYSLFGKKDSCRLPSPEERQRFIT